MTSNQIEKYSETIFENIKHVNEYGQEFWYARELQEILEYSQWRRFKDVIMKAKVACENSNNNVEDHFADVGKIVPLASGAERDIHARKGLRKSQQILDHMGSTELAANLFRATQTDEKLRREQVMVNLSKFAARQAF